MAICNVVGSTIAREADGGIYLHAGPEIGVASTKAYTSQCVVMALLGSLLRPAAPPELRSRPANHQRTRSPAAASRARARRESTKPKRIAEKYASCNNFLYLGRQYNFPTALEGALKLKEISYIHAEGYPAAEMKHGPIALVDEHTPSVFIVPQGAVYQKVIANMEEIKARGGPVIAIVTEGDSEATEMADDVIRVPGRRRLPAADRGRRAAAAPGLPRRNPPRLRRRQAAQPGEERDGGVNRRHFLEVLQPATYGRQSIPSNLKCHPRGVACRLSEIRVYYFSPDFNCLSSRCSRSFSGSTFTHLATASRANSSSCSCWASWNRSV